MRNRGEGRDWCKANYVVGVKIIMPHGIIAAGGIRRTVSRHIYENVAIIMEWGVDRTPLLDIIIFTLFVMRWEVSMRKDRETKIDALRREGCLNGKYQGVKDELFVERDFFDPKDMVQVKYEMLRRVSADGQSVTRAAAAFGFSRLSFYQARSAFEAGGLPGLVPLRRGPRGAHKLTDEVVVFIRRTRSEDASLGARELARLVEERFGVSVHPRTIERRLAAVEKKRR